MPNTWLGAVPNVPYTLFTPFPWYPTFDISRLGAFILFKLVCVAVACNCTLFNALTITCVCCCIALATEANPFVIPAVIEAPKAVYEFFKAKSVCSFALNASVVNLLCAWIVANPLVIVAVAELTELLILAIAVEFALLIAFIAFAFEALLVFIVLAKDLKLISTVLDIVDIAVLIPDDKVVIVLLVSR